MTNAERKFDPARSARRQSSMLINYVWNVCHRQGFIISVHKFLFSFKQIQFIFQVDLMMMLWREETSNWREQTYIRPSSITDKRRLRRWSLSRRRNPQEISLKELYLLGRLSHDLKSIKYWRRRLVGNQTDIK